MKFGLGVPQLGPNVTPRVIRDFSARAEELGYDSLWVQDGHILFPHEPLDEAPAADEWPWPYKNAMSSLELMAYVTANTSTIEIGTSVLVTAFHRPLLLAKQTATLDILSGGRIKLGFGLGWSQDEYNVSGVPFEKRGPRSTDFLRAMRACWAENPVEYEGQFYSVPKSDTSPKPVRRDAAGRPSIPLIGGYLSEPGYRRVAEFCDAWHPALGEPEQWAEGKAAIDKIAQEEFGKGPLDLIMRVFAAPMLPGLSEVTVPPVHGSWAGTVEEMLPRVLKMKDYGVSEIIFDTNYFLENPGEEGWLAHPDYLLPLLQGARDG